MAARKERNKKTSRPHEAGGSYYSYGNVAYELQPDYTPYHVQEETEEGRKESARAAQLEARENKVSFVKMVVVAFVLFIGCIAFMGMNVMADQAEVSLRKQKSKLEDLKSTNAILEAELTEQLDMEYIKTEAMERLGMSEPQPYQVVYINVPKQSYTVQHDTQEATAKTSLVERVLNFFKKD